MLGAGGGGALAGEGIFKPFNWEAEARSPWDTSRVPGWSSSGGAAAVAAGMLPVAIGSAGGGYTRLPAAYSGVVRMHQTVGLRPEHDYAKPRPPTGITVGPLSPRSRHGTLVSHLIARLHPRDPFSIPPLHISSLYHISNKIT